MDIRGAQGEVLKLTFPWASHNTLEQLFLKSTIVSSNWSTNKGIAHGMLQDDVPLTEISASQL